jgi:5-formyltetrahydrofolate cyclo-ligase
MSQSVLAQKAKVRTQIRQLRKQINPSESLTAGYRVSQFVSQHPVYSTARKVACFISFDGEINTQPLIDQLIRDKGQCYLPKLRPLKPNRLWFMPFDGTAPLVNNSLGIPEVDLPVQRAIRPSSIDLVLMPLVAFDSLGNRLGMGGGYYDATLAHLRNRQAGRNRPYFLGLAFSQQQVARLPESVWDLPLDGVFTEQEFYSFESRLAQPQ